MRYRSNFLIWVIIVIAIATLFLAWQYVNFRLSNRTLPVGMTMAGLSVEGLTHQQALNALEVAFATPIDITYRDHQYLTLSPESVRLRYDADETAAILEETLAPREGVAGFFDYILGHSPSPTDVPVPVSYSEEALDNFLARVAKQYNQPPQEPVVLPESLAIRSGRPGYELDIDASRRQLASALISAREDDQAVALVVRETEAPSLDIDALNQLLQSLLNDHPDLTPGIFVKDLQTGEELGINAEVAYAGLSVLKIAIMEEAYRNLELPLDLEVADWLSDTMGVTSSNFKANLLLQEVIGNNGDVFQGVDKLTTSMHHLGLRNTFMTTPYDAENSPHTIVTPANSRTDITTEPDPHMQTTPLDIGLLLEMIYQCSRGGGALLASYPEELTSQECSQMIEWMRMNRIDSLIEAGVPVGTDVAHKQGYTSDTHADAGLIFSPNGDFVLTVFIYRLQYLEWEESAPLISAIATATYNYFNPTP